MCPESAIMQNNDRNANSTMPDRLYGEHYPDSFLDMPRSVREPNVATLGDYIRHLQEVDKQSDKPCVACEPVESSFDHICPNNPILTCNCTDPKFCAELGNDPDNLVDGNKRCPDSGRICNERDCPDECLGDKDNLNTSTKGKDSVCSRSCVVIGVVCKTWTPTTKRVLRTTASQWHTK